MQLRLYVQKVVFFRRSYVQKVFCSEGPMFRRSCVQNILCLEGSRSSEDPLLEGSMFRRSYVQKVLYSVASMFRRPYVQKLLFSGAPMFGMPFINKRPEVLYHPPPIISFCDHKYLKSRLVVAILNFCKITCTFPDGG